MQVQKGLEKANNYSMPENVRDFCKSVKNNYSIIFKNTDLSHHS